MPIGYAVPQPVSEGLQPPSGAGRRSSAGVVVAAVAAAVVLAMIGGAVGFVLGTHRQGEAEPAELATVATTLLPVPAEHVDPAERMPPVDEMTPSIAIASSSER